MVTIEREEMSRLLSVVGRLLAVAEVISIDAGVFSEASAFQDQYGLEPEDSVILACVVSDLRTRDQSQETCFVSRDKKAFFDPGIGAELANLNCRYMTKFGSAKQYLERFEPGS